MADTYTNKVVEINKKQSKKGKEYIELFTLDKNGRRHKVITFDPKVQKVFTVPGMYSMTWEKYEGEEYPTLIAAEMASQDGPMSSENGSGTTKRVDTTKDRRITALSLISSVLSYMGQTKSSMIEFEAIFEQVAAKVAAYENAKAEDGGQ